MGPNFGPYLIIGPLGPHISLFWSPGKGPTIIIFSFLVATSTFSNQKTDVCNTLLSVISINTDAYKNCLLQKPGDKFSREELNTCKKYYLNLFDARPSALSVSQSLFAYPISGSWIMGQGRLDDNPITTEGCSWNFRFSRGEGTLWRPPISASGGNWFTGSGFEASQSLTHKTEDIRMDVTDIVNKWLDETIPNNGFIAPAGATAGL